MDGDGALIKLMQRRAVLKKKLRDWTKAIKSEGGRDPTPEGTILFAPLH